MKIFHTSDWHIGKKVNNFSMIENQKFALNELMKLIEVKKPDVLIVAGDLYDRSIPPVEAVELLDDTLTNLITEYKIKVITISGNHDSGERINFASNILNKQGLYMMGDEHKLFDKIAIDNVNFYVIPYKDPASVRNIIDDEETKIRTHEDAMRYIVNLIKENMDTEAFNVIVAHGYVSKLSNQTNYVNAGLDVSLSEKPLAIGGTDIIDYHVFDGFDYVALGHLHGRQQVGREGIRYSGSLCKYSFSEINQIKGITEVVMTAGVDIKPHFQLVKNKIVEITNHPLAQLQDFKITEGTINDLVQHGREVFYTTGEYCQDYIHAVLTDDDELFNPIAQLREVFPNILSLSKKSSFIQDEIVGISHKSKNPAELFAEFYELFGNGEYNTNKQTYVKKTIEEVISYRL